jgi:hypothetical protein
MSKDTENETSQQEKGNLRGEVLLSGFIKKALLAFTQVLSALYAVYYKYTLDINILLIFLLLRLYHLYLVTIFEDISCALSFNNDAAQCQKC